MEYIDCTWEFKNIGEKTVEILVLESDIFDEEELVNNISNYEYIVIKVPVCKMDFCVGLQKMGFTFIESQFHISKKYKDFDVNDRLVRVLATKAHFTNVEDEEDLKYVINSMNSNMFSTDRICLDKNLGPQLGLRRYRNWIISEFESRKSQIINYNFNDKNIGFGMFRIDNRVLYGLLGGIYKKHQDCGLGLLTPIAGLLFCKEHNIRIEKMITSISSNNVPVMQLYNYLNFTINSIKYVYIKHQYNDSI